ncbi:Flagellar hook-length control protein FliK, partial [Caulobacter sp. AP07]|uniref:flagellar hook-length control protein FliK n=1 Tax=Caulobacter sp. AP07 TaxID=1144304 RepID=UPI000271E41C
ARAAANPATLPDTPARAVAAAASRAAARQAGLAPLMADMAQAAAEPGVPRPVKAAIEQVLALRARMDGQISGPEVRQALQRSGLFLEARLAAATPTDGVSRQPTGTLTAPPKVVPTPTPNSDMKAALLVFREVVKTWMDVAPPTSAQAGGLATPPATTSTPNPAAPAAAFSTPLADRGAPQGLTAAPAVPMLDPDEEALLARPMPVEDAPQGLQKPAVAWSDAWNASRAGRPPPSPPQPALLPAFGAIVADDFPPLPLAARAPTAVALAYGGPEVAAGAPSNTPPPYAGAPTHAQAAAQPGLPPGSDPRAIGHRLLAETGAALARTELLQIASLPDAPPAGRPAEEQGARWVFDMPFLTPQGPAVAQFEISRDGGGAGGEGGRQMGRTWRARFSLDVEPMGPVHAQVALTGDRARVSLWAERPASMARLRGGQDRLDAALREAALEPEVAFHAGQPRSAAAAPGQFLDQAT